MRRLDWWTTGGNSNDLDVGLRFRLTLPRSRASSLLRFLVLGFRVIWWASTSASQPHSTAQFYGSVRGNRESSQSPFPLSAPVKTKPVHVTPPTRVFFDSIRCPLTALFSSFPFIKTASCGSAIAQPATVGRTHLAPQQVGRDRRARRRLTAIRHPLQRRFTQRKKSRQQRKRSHAAALIVRKHAPTLARTFRVFVT